MPTETQPQFACPCCGHRTRPEPALGTRAICPVCYWEDVELDGWTGSTDLTLREAQDHYAATGACDPAWRDEVRPATPGEARAPDWLPMAAREAADTEAAIQLIDDAFGHLRRGDGMRVYEAELADDYGQESERNAPRKHDTYQSWHGIDDDVISTFYSVLSFFDPEGFRFHLPAYMTWTLKNYADADSNTPSSTIFALMRYGRGDELRGWQDTRYEVFDQPQRAAIAAFLRAIGDHQDDPDARKALRYWSGPR